MSRSWDRRNAPVVARVTLDGDRILGEYRGGVKKSAMMLSAF
jgi:hypothetical protein